MVDRIVIDPVTRIEGHLRIEAQLEGGAVKTAYSSGTMFRGLELILQGRDPREAWIWAQRICGVCTTVHAHTSVSAVEAALGRRDPAERPADPQPDRGCPAHPGPRHPLLPPARARLGGRGRRPQGRSRRHGEARPVDLALAADRP